MTREKAIEDIFKKLSDDDLVIVSLGKMSREAWEIYKREKYKFGIFPVQGIMGGSIGIGLGVALNTKKQVYVLIGDGALLMKLGSLATIARYKPKNLKIIVLNNFCYDSTGGQETAFDVEETNYIIAQGCEVLHINRGNRKDLSRPNISCKEITKQFMKKIHE